MKTLQDTYPVFEVNQVLTNAHLNEMFNYLDEQERLTRANLIGIGIVCGLEIQLVPAIPTIHLSRGCGVTSEGYLILEPEDVVLTSYREYKLPQDLDYSPFKDKSTDPNEHYPLWELFPAGEPNTTPLGTPTVFLSDKGMLLFLELKREGLRNCSPNDCDDKGFKVTATLRRLLVKLDDLKKIIAEVNQLDPGLTFSDLEAALMARLDLPDLRLPRYDVPNTGPATSKEVLAAFLAVFRNGKLALNTEKALKAVYNAFKPIVQGAYPSNPFTNFSANFGFLDNAPTTTAQVRFLPYYYDFFDDLLKAYDEFRWKGVELLCACCPPESLFPRHLMLGVLFPASVTNSSVYRHHFLASSALSDCEIRTKEVLQLFQRIAEMIARFTNTPPLPQPSVASDTDVQIRITPSKLDDEPLSDKAIPYFYLQDGTPPLYHLWNFEKLRWNRANQNLSYRSDEYTPPAPAFVTNALRYDLEPHDFLRIEGHLGKNFRDVLKTLLTLKTRFRLPIEIVALRTGAFDENVPIDLTKEECRFQDLETLYDALREELLNTLCEGLMYFYDISIPGIDLAGGIPQLPLLKKYAPNYRHKKDTVGAWYEKYLAQIQSRPYIDVDQNRIDEDQVLTVYCFLFAGTVAPEPEYYAHIVSVYYFTKLAEILPSSLDKLGYADFENKYQDLMGLIRYFRSDAKKNISLELEKFIPQEDLIDQFDQVLFSCKLEPIKAIHEEYLRRIREVKKKHFLSFFLQKNPGIQHKAGVPIGGTFIMVYHEDPKAAITMPDSVLDDIGANIPTFGPTKGDTAALSDAFKRISGNPEFVTDPDIRFLIGTFTGQVSDISIALPPAASDEADEIIEAAIDELADGTVITDFFLPYLCCSECASIQYVLPTPPLGLSVELSCTGTNGSAEATLTPQGGMPPFTYQLDNQPFRELTGTPLLTVGSHTIVIRDSAGAESASQSLTVPGLLAIGTESYIDEVAAKTYQVRFNISGGTAPYTSESGTVTDSIFTSTPVNSDETISVTIKDSVGCGASKSFQHTVEDPCDLPCDGQSRRCAYRLWLQPPVDGAPYEMYRQEGDINLRFNGEDIVLSGADSILQMPTQQLNGDFHNAIGGAVKILNHEIERALKAKFGEKLGNNRLVVTYAPAATDPFGILWIEYFVCETFTIEFDFTFAKPSPTFSLRMRYTNEPSADGAVLINRRLNNKETRVPAFDCSERNQCDGSDFGKLCEGPDPKPVLAIEALGNNRFQFEGRVDNMPASEIIAWVWDVPQAIATEPHYEGKTVQVTVRIPKDPVRLTAITQKGCFGFDQRDFTP